MKEIEFKGKMYIEIDGGMVPLSTEIANVTTEWEPSEETISPRFPYEGTLTMTDFKAPISLKHLDKFKIIRMGGKMI
jgi:hypothetical protein